MVSPMPAPYPISLEVDPTLRDRNRMTCAFRIVLALPILRGPGRDRRTRTRWPAAAAHEPSAPPEDLLVVAPALMILFRQKYPLVVRLERRRCCGSRNRVGAAYLLLLRDEVPVDRRGAGRCTSTSRTPMPAPT